MVTHSSTFSEFERNVSNLRRLSYGLHYLDMKKRDYIEWLKKEGEEFPETAFKQELHDTINLELEVSNILLRTYIEKYGFNKCGKFKDFINQYLPQINSHTMKYQRDLPPLPVLDINRELRNQSIHSEHKYERIKSLKKPFQILSESVGRITNDSGEKEIVLFHDLDKNTRTAELRATRRRMSLANAQSSFMTYGELLRDEVLECIRQIDLI